MINRCTHHINNNENWLSKSLVQSVTVTGTESLVHTYTQIDKIFICKV